MTIWQAEESAQCQAQMPSCKPSLLPLPNLLSNVQLSVMSWNSIIIDIHLNKLNTTSSGLQQFIHTQHCPVTFPTESITTSNAMTSNCTEYSTTNIYARRTARPSNCTKRTAQTRSCTRRTGRTSTCTGRTARTRLHHENSTNEHQDRTPASNE